MTISDRLRHRQQQQMERDRARSDALAREICAREERRLLAWITDIVRRIGRLGRLG